MRHFLPLLLLGPLALTPASALSQTSVDPRALPAPATHAASPPAPAPAPSANKPSADKPGTAREGHRPAASHARPTAGKPAAGKPEAGKPEAGKPALAKSARSKAPGAPEVRLGTVPPAPPRLPPALPVPMRPPLPPTPASVVADAPGSAEKLAPGDLAPTLSAGEKTSGGLRLTFGAGRADLNPATDSALRDLAHAAPPGSRFNVVAFAAGIPEDPSTPRRVSLSRALAVRSVLIAEGITSERIIVRALGAEPVNEGSAPADRADISLLPPIGGTLPSPQPTAPQ